jgi:hypothetical protein
VTVVRHVEAELPLWVNFFDGFTRAHPFANAFGPSPSTRVHPCVTFP